MSNNYIFTNAKMNPEEKRLQLIEQVFDPLTKEIALSMGLTAGMSCLEIGPGAGSIMQWLCDGVGINGHVSAIDLNTQYIEKKSHPALSIIKGDVTKYSFERQFDFIHARYVFVHLLNAEATFEKLHGLLKSDGWLLIEEPDFSQVHVETSNKEWRSSFYAVCNAVLAMFKTIQLDPALGSSLKDKLTRVRFSKVNQKAMSSPVVGNSLMAQMMMSSAVYLQEKYMSTGLVTKEDIENFCALSRDTNSQIVYYSHYSAWGQKKSLES